MSLTATIIPVFDTIGVPLEVRLPVIAALPACTKENLQKLQKWLVENREYDGDAWRDMFWLADNHDTIAAMPSDTEEGTSSETPIDPHWQSPFVGKPIDDILNFMENIPQSHRELVDSHHFVVLDKDLREQGLVKMYRRKDWADPDEDFTGLRCPEVFQNGVTWYAQLAGLACMDLSPLEGGDWEARVDPSLGPPGGDPGWWDRQDATVPS